MGEWKTARSIGRLQIPGIHTGERRDTSAFAEATMKEALRIKLLAPRQMQSGQRAVAPHQALHHSLHQATAMIRIPKQSAWEQPSMAKFANGASSRALELASARTPPSPAVPKARALWSEPDCILGCKAKRHESAFLDLCFRAIYGEPCLLL